MTGPIIPADQWPDEFKGDNAKLIGCINAMLSMDAAGALVPHGIGGHARSLLAAAAHRLAPAPAIDLDKIVPAEKKLPELYLAEYHENKGWNACRAKMLALIDGQSVSDMPQKGRCPNNAAPGGCQLPNRFCTFPSCDKVDELQPTKGEGE